MSSHKESVLTRSQALEPYRTVIKPAEEQRAYNNVRAADLSTELKRLRCAHLTGRLCSPSPSDELAYITNLKEKQSEIHQSEVIALTRRIKGAL